MAIAKNLCQVMAARKQGQNVCLGAEELKEVCLLKDIFCKDWSYTSLLQKMEREKLITPDQVPEISSKVDQMNQIVKGKLGEYGLGRLEDRPDDRLKKAGMDAVFLADSLAQIGCQEAVKSLRHFLAGTGQPLVRTSRPSLGDFAVLEAGITGRIKDHASQSGTSSDWKPKLLGVVRRFEQSNPPSELSIPAGDISGLFLNMGISFLISNKTPEYKLVFNGEKISSVSVTEGKIQRTAKVGRYDLFLTIQVVHENTFDMNDANLLVEWRNRPELQSLQRLQNEGIARLFQQKLTWKFKVKVEGVNIFKQ